MTNISADAAHLRELAAKCLRAAASLSDDHQIASLRQMAAEYEGMAIRMEQPLMPNPQPPAAQ
jgi:hypothetical protein